jgi:hypothetical protein
MKITVNQLRRIIKEEVSRVLKENPVQDQGPGMPLEAGQMVTTNKEIPAETEGGKQFMLPLGTYEFAPLDDEWAALYASSKVGRQKLARYVKKSDLVGAIEMV